MYDDSSHTSMQHLNNEAGQKVTKEAIIFPNLNKAEIANYTLPASTKSFTGSKSTSNSLILMHIMMLKHILTFKKVFHKVGKPATWARNPRPGTIPW